MKKVRKVLFVDLLSVTVAAAFLWSAPATAQMVRYYGRVMDAKQVPQSLQTTTVVASGTSGSLGSPAGLSGPSAWGTGLTDYKVNPGDFIHQEGCVFDGPADLSNFEGIMPASGQSSTCLGAPVHLPSGASLQAVVLDYNDTFPALPPASMSIGFNKSGSFGATTFVADLTPTVFATGDTSVTFNLINPETIDNNGFSYYVLAILDRSTIDPSQFEKIYNLHFLYKLQVSPAPAVASFTDVPTNHPFFKWVEALKGSGITAGCGGGNFCPDSPVTRAQMAVFLSVALGLSWPN
ncbi:MAG: S-layer homology domain-containing protein [Acidobacteriia bacterium]|nr:S-layer homology domain-containing protein [Terriglobia bacterium]